MIDEFGCAGMLQGLSVFVCVCVFVSERELKFNGGRSH